MHAGARLRALALCESNLVHAIPLEKLCRPAETRCGPLIRRELFLAVMCALSVGGGEQLLPAISLSQHEPDALLRRGDRLAVTQLSVPAEAPADDRAARCD